MNVLKWKTEAKNVMWKNANFQWLISLSPVATLELNVNILFIVIPTGNDYYWILKRNCFNPKYEKLVDFRIHNKLVMTLKFQNILKTVYFVYQTEKIRFLFSPLNMN